MVLETFSISGSGFDAFYPAHTSYDSVNSYNSFLCVEIVVQLPPGDLVVSYHKVKSTNYGQRTDFGCITADWCEP